MQDEEKDIPAAIAVYTEAIQLDPNYALAFAGRSYALSTYAGEMATGAAIREGYEKAESDARRALALAPDLADAHMALATVLATGALDFTRANEEFERAVALAPGNAQVLTRKRPVRSSHGTRRCRHCLRPARGGTGPARSSKLYDTRPCAVWRSAI